MPSSRITDNWLQFEGIKYSLTDFLKAFSNSSQEPINTIVNFITTWQSDSEFISQKTSGSTGEPKIIEIAKSQIRASALATLETLGLTTGDHALLSINPAYIGGKMMVARAIIGGLNLSIAPIVGNPLKNLASDQRVDFFSFVPYQFEKILDESPNRIHFLNQSKVIILGGAPVSDSLAKKIKLKIRNTKVYSTYGMTETVSHVALKLINSEQKEAFQALKGITFSTDHRDCLEIHASHISGRDRLVTNDVVNLLSPTQFHWLGRYDHVINSGGVKIHPEVLEKEITSIIDRNNISNRFFVFGLPDEKLGESMNIIFEGQADESYLIKILKDNLPAFHAPKKIFSIEAFVETGSGKLNRMETIKQIKEI